MQTTRHVLLSTGTLLRGALGISLLAVVVLTADFAVAETQFAPVSPGSASGGILPQPSSGSAAAAAAGQFNPVGGANAGGVLGGPGNAAGAGAGNGNETIAEILTGKQRTRAENALSNLVKAAEQLPQGK